MPGKYAGAVPSAESGLTAGPANGARRIVVSGATGLIGGNLLPALSRVGWAPERLTRHAPVGNDIAWNPAAGTIDAARLDGVEAVIHLAGENIGAQRWTTERKARIRDSRVRGTTLLASTLAGLDRKPRVLLSVSAIGIYGDRDDELLDESSALGNDFLAEVGELWETSANPAREAGIRVVHPRLGLVLSADGGALERMLLPANLFLGGQLGSGRQWWSWVHMDDVVGAMLHLLDVPQESGPVNVVAPKPVRNADFMQRLREVLHRPAPLPTPAFALRLLLGEMADALLLSSQRVSSAKLVASGYRFRYSELGAALIEAVGRQE
ncbi:MAG TPA: TIGR01777 family oxidoreductase [Gemmatimonadales bacterium]|nr:TIGR01777 family oxidoreductase [Gemmatimonadales bacterium]